MHESECNWFVRCAVPRFGGNRLFANRLAGHHEPLFPFVGTLWFVVGEQQEPIAEWTATVLGLYETQADPV